MAARTRTYAPALALVACQRYNERIHGRTPDSAPDIDQHFLVIDRFLPLRCPEGASVLRLEAEEEDADTSEDEEGDEEEDEEEDDGEEGEWWRAFPDFQAEYDTFYAQSAPSAQQGVQLHLAAVAVLSSGETVAVLKTVWLRIFQRKVKGWLQRRRALTRRMASPGWQYRREVFGPRRPLGVGPGPGKNLCAYHTLPPMDSSPHPLTTAAAPAAPAGASSFESFLLSALGPKMNDDLRQQILHDAAALRNTVAMVPPPGGPDMQAGGGGNRGGSQCRPTYGKYTRGGGFVPLT